MLPADRDTNQETKGGTMAIVAVFQGPTLTQELYEQSINQLTNGAKQRLEAPSDWPVAGLLVHIAGQGPTGFRVVDVWESAEALQRFSDHLLPILQTLGVAEQPEVYPALALVTA